MSCPSCPCLAVTHENGAEVVVWGADGASRTFVYNGSPDKLCFQTHGSDFAEGAYVSPCCNTNDLPKGKGAKTICSKKKGEKKAQRYHNIQYDQTNGKEQLVLEYDCTDCGENGLRKFPLVSKRKLENDGEVHVFKSGMDTKPFQWTECFRFMQNADIFDTKSERFQNAIKRTSREENKFPTRVIGVKECPKSNNGRCAGSFGQDKTAATVAGEFPLLAPDFVDLVRSELDRCCEDEACSNNKMDLLDSGDLIKAKKSCRSKKSCSFSNKNKVDESVLIDDEKIKDDMQNAVENISIDDEKAMNDMQNAKVKKSCCSGKSCSASKNKSKVEDISIDDEKAKDDMQNAKVKKSCCSGKSCSASKNKSKDEDIWIDNEKVNDDMKDAKVKKSCCSENSCSASGKNEESVDLDAVNDDNSYKKCCETFWWEKCATSTCSKTASTVTDLDNNSIDLASHNNNTVRSVIECSQICCAAEIPAVNKSLDPLDGIIKVLINVPNKCVMVDHVPSVITAENIVNILNKARLGAILKRDGGTTSTSTLGRSQLFVEEICCSSEIRAINRILCSLKGVSQISINVQGKLVFADHDTQIVSAQQLCDALNEKCFGACVRHDAVDDQTETLSTFVRSTILVIAGLPEIESLKAFMSRYSAREIESFIADTTENKIHIVHNPLVLPIDDIVTSLEALNALRSSSAVTISRLEVSVEIDGAKHIDWDFPPLEEGEDTREDVQKLPKPTVMISGLFWIISMFSYIGGNWDYLKYVALASVVIGLPPIGIKAITRLRSFQFDTNVLMASAVCGALALQEFAEAAAVTFLFSMSDWLETRATTRARNALSAIVRLRPNHAEIFHPATKELIIIPASSVPVGALVSVKAGAQIPCDGIVVGGNSVVDESSLTGESRPVKKRIKDNVSGGTINSGMNELLIRTTSSSENSAVSRLIRLVEEAQSNRSETEKMVDAFAKRYTPIVIVGALLMVSIPWAWGRNVGRQWTEMGLILLVVACPCALIISTPVTYVAGLTATAQRGILIKGGAYLEALSKVKKVAFDKTGTLTKGQFALLHLNCFGNMKREDVLGYLALVEERASHPIAEAIVKAVKNEGVSVPKNLPLKNLTELEGEGVTATAGNVRLYAGNQRLFSRIGFAIPEGVREDSKSWAKLGGTVGYLGVEGYGVVCAYCCADSPREESSTVLQTLKDDGIEVVMLTGDNRDAALLIGAQIGLEESDIRYELLPEDKLIIIGDMMESKNRGLVSSCFHESELVMMCGDGINDAPALASADIGLAMGAGAALAMETSDLTLLDSNLEKLLYSIKMGKSVSRKIRENIIFSFVTKVIVVGLTFAGYSHLWAAIAVDVGSMLIVTLNGMTLLPSKAERKKNYLDYHPSVANEDIESDHIE